MFRTILKQHSPCTSNIGSFSEYRGTDYVSSRNTQKIKDRKQSNYKLRLIPSYREYKAFRYLQKDLNIDKITRFVRKVISAKKND